MSYLENLEDLPEVVETDSAGDFHYVQAGAWSFCIEEELEQGEGAWWSDARALVAFALYMDKYVDGMEKQE